MVSIMTSLGSVHGAPVIPLGVDEFGRSGTLGDLHRHFDIDADAIINATLLVTQGGRACSTHCAATLSADSPSGPSASPGRITAIGSLENHRLNGAGHG
jgi:pyruvate dehydrogenase complex dehydrogenase (E1) component